MIKHLVNAYSTSFLSRWVVLVFDIIIVAFSFVFAYLVWFKFNLLPLETLRFFWQLIIVSSIYLVFFLLTRSYSGIIRHTGLSDAFRLLTAASFSVIVLVASNIMFYIAGQQDIYRISYSILIIHFLLTLFFLIGSRVVVKLFFIQITRQFTKEKIPVLIYGAGAAGMITKNALIKDRIYRYEIVSYIDDNPGMSGKRLEGIPVVNQYRALRKSYIKRHDIKQLIIAIQGLHPNKKTKIVEAALDLHLQVKIVPAFDNWVNGQLSSQQLQRVKIEELLERDPISLDNKNISREINNKVVMVTGGAGSIGCEIVRQVLIYKPKLLIVVDQAESPIYDLQFEIRNNKDFKPYLNNIEFIVASVKDKFRMDEIFDTYKPDVIYHAAAYKHVPLMEENPYEAIMVNVFGTKVIADLSNKHGVEKFVMVSTDKAVNPTNVMGATKRIAEIYIQSLSDSASTKYVTTRFGNVLGSNGSVVPLFRKQIEAGGPITVTHKEITRYFMTIPEACNLVLEAGAMGDGSDIFVFDMGKPVRIYDMAKKMIGLYGLSKDEIQIVETGLRPGEKLYEELLNNKENTLQTHHPKIMRAKVNTLTHNQIIDHLNKLSELIVESDCYTVVAKMKDIVPEYVSNNSIFEKLDKKPATAKKKKD